MARLSIRKRSRANTIPQLVERIPRVSTENEKLRARIEELEAERDQLKAELEAAQRRLEQYESNEHWISVAEAAEILGVHRNRVLQLVNAGLIEGNKVGNTWSIDRASVESRAENPPRAGRRW